MIQERHLTRHLAALALVAIAIASSCSLPSENAVAPASSADPAHVVRDATTALRRRPTVAVTVEGSIRPNGPFSDTVLRSEGVLTGRDHGRVHLTHVLPGSGRSSETYLVGTDVVVTTTSLPDIDRPWTRFDLSVLDSATGADRERVLPSADEALMLAVNAREPSPLTALAVLDGATKVEQRGTEEVDGRVLERYDVTTPAGAVLDAYGPAVAAQASVDCQAGVASAVWLDEAGALRRLESRFDHLALAGSVAISFGDEEAGEPDRGPDTSAFELPPDDQIHDLTASVATAPVGPRLEADWPRARPCSVTGADGSPGRWSRSCPDDDSTNQPAWGDLERRAVRDPRGQARAWLAFAEPRPIAEALVAPADVRITGFLAVYPSTGEMTTKAGFSGIEVSSPQQVADLIRARANPSDDTSEIRLATVLVDGTWQALADAAVDCAYVLPELAPWNPAPTVGVP